MTQVTLLGQQGEKINYDLEHHVIRLLREKGVKAPEPITSNINTEEYPFTFSFQKEVEGVNMWEVPKEHWPQLLKQVGEQLAILYSIPIPGFGTLSTKVFREKGRLEGKNESWHDFLKSSIDRKLSKLAGAREESQGFSKSSLSHNQRNKLINILNRSGELYTRLDSIKGKLAVQGSLFHRDLHADHIISKNGRLQGILDFNNVSSGDPLRDMASFSTHHPGNFYKYLVEGSGTRFDENKFHLYRLIVSFGKIHYRYKNNYLHKNPGVLDYALEELEK